MSSRWHMRCCDESAPEPIRSRHRKPPPTYCAAERQRGPSCAPRQAGGAVAREIEQLRNETTHGRHAADTCEKIGLMMRARAACRRFGRAAQLLALAVFFLCVSAVAAKAQAPSAGANDCRGSRSRVEVNARVAPLVVSANFTYAQISAVAQKSGQPLRHPPYGFYLGRIWYQFAIHDLPDSAKSCAPKFQVAADLALVERRIEIASDLPRSTCLSQMALDHYNRHAEADARAFKEFMAMMPGKVEAALAAIAPAGRDDVEHDVQAALDAVLAKLDRAREAAQAVVDNPLEVNKLAHPVCAAI